MKLITVQEALGRKFKRQQALGGLELDASGHCAHIGKLSPGCYGCFVPNGFTFNLGIGYQCNSKCPYCPQLGKDKELTRETIKATKAKIIALANMRKTSDLIPRFSFSSGKGEPLKYLSVISDYMRFMRKVEPDMERRPWYFLYTNGLLADVDMILGLKDLGFDEIRYHLGASGFSKIVYNSIELAVKHIKVVTVETPAWPPHRDQLFEMLPIIHDMGVKHLNLGEVQLTQHNYNYINKILPDAEIYQNYEIHLYDGGLVYDIMDEVVTNNYSFSALDCNSLVKSIQLAPGKSVAHEPIEDLCEGYDAPECH